MAILSQTNVRNGVLTLKKLLTIHTFNAEDNITLVVHRNDGMPSWLVALESKEATGSPEVTVI